MATTKSTQITNEDATPRVINSGGSYKYAIHWDYTVAALALVTTDVVELCKIPAGARVLLGESYFNVSATTGASTTIDIGYKAYTAVDGTTTAADVDGLVNGYTSSSTAINLLTETTVSPLGALANAVGVADFSDAVDDVTIIATCLDSGGTFDGDIADIWTGYFTVEV